MTPWRTTTEMAVALYRYCTLHRISYGECMRRAVAVLVSGDAFHDFEADPITHAASVFPDSQFDQQSRV